MNAARRKEIGKAVQLLEDAKNILEYVCDEEEEAFDNMPESLQESERGEAMAEAIEILSYNYEELQDHIDNLMELI